MPVKKMIVLAWLDERDWPHDPDKMTDEQKLKVRSHFKICGARARTKTPCCKDQAISGRCNNHGDDSPRGIEHYNYQGKGEGAFLPQSLQQMYRTFINDPDRLSMEKNIATLDVRNAQLLLSLEEGDPGELWTTALKSLEHMQAAARRNDKSGMSKHLDDLDQTLREGEKVIATWGEYRENTELRRKLSDTESKQMERSRQVLTSRQAMALVQALVLAIDEEVHDEDTRSRIGERFIRITAAGNIPTLEPAEGPD